MLNTSATHRVFTSVFMECLQVSYSIFPFSSWLVCWFVGLLVCFMMRCLTFTLSRTVTLGLFTFVRTVLLVRLGVQASAVLHKNLLDSILRAPQSFFDTTPIGRILSRFSKDFYSIDVDLSDQLDMFLFCVLTVLVSLGTITFVTPWFGIAVVPLGYMYFKFLNYFRNVSRETKRLESISRSPVYGQFSETLGGLTTIRAYGQAMRFQYSFDTKIDENIRAW